MMIGVCSTALLVILYSGVAAGKDSNEKTLNLNPRLPKQAEIQGYVIGGNVPLLMELVPAARNLMKKITKVEGVRRYTKKSRVKQGNDSNQEGGHKTEQTSVNLDGGRVRSEHTGDGGRVRGKLTSGGKASYNGGVMAVKGVDYIGRGYNLVFGNPDIIALSTSDNEVTNIATDPGLRANFILALTRTGAVPEQVNYFTERSCFKAMTNRLITGANSQQKKLFDGFDQTRGFNIKSLVERSFMGSQLNNNIGTDIRRKQRIYVESRHICTYATARYRLAADQAEMILNGDFKRAVCSMPDEYNDTTKHHYTTLIDEFGTSVIIGVTIGTMAITRIELKTENILKNVLEGKIDRSSVGTNVIGIHTILNFNLDNTTLDLSSDSKIVRNTITWTLGSDNDPKPTKLSIMNLDDVMVSQFWHVHCQNNESQIQTCCNKLQTYRKNIHEALTDYGTNKDIPAPTKQDDIVKVPLNWPRGYYGLPATKYGCPEQTENMKWSTGIRLQLTHSESSWSPGIHWPVGLERGYIVQHYCIKDTSQTTHFDMDWPAGTYCILRKQSCPTGFENGWVRWHDSISSHDHAYLGMLPDGVYDSMNTRVEYCCRKDEPTVKEIDLPMQRPFYLMMNGNECQRVRGMTVKVEWLYWDGWDLCAFCSRTSQMGGSHPRNDFKRENNKLYYCYYEANVAMETAMTVTLGDSRWNQRLT